MADYSISDAPASLDFSTVRGDTWTKAFTVTQNDVAVDLTGSTMYFTIRVKNDISDLSDAESIYTQNVSSFTGAGSNIFTLNIPHADSVKLNPLSYVYDISWKNTSDEIKTLFQGKFKIDDTTTNRDSEV